MTTQDGYDWPTPHAEAPPLDKYQPMAPYWREQLAVLDLRERAELRAELTAASLRRLAERTVPHHPV